MTGRGRALLPRGSVVGLGLLWLTATGCLTGRRAATATLPVREASVLLNDLDARRADWNTLGLRLESTASAMGKAGTFTLNVRMARDSVIWMSISPALGVEAARVLLTPDSVQVMSKLPGSRFVFQGNYNQLEDAVQAPVSFELMQDLLLGQPLMMNPEREEYVSKVDGDRYVLMSKYDRNVRKLVGTDDKELSPDDSLSIVANDKKAERLLEKAEKKAEKKDDVSEELLVKRFWVDGTTYDPVQDVIDDLLRSRTVRVERSDFDETELGRIPSRVRMTAKGPEGVFDALIYTKRRRAGRAYDFPFSIPDDFERRTEL
ncbi:MAG: DUF4292 domain-containing protein [Flavobacteriales bacterium]